MRVLPVLAVDHVDRTPPPAPSVGVGGVSTGKPQSLIVRLRATSANCNRLLPAFMFRKMVVVDSFGFRIAPSPPLFGLDQNVAQAFLPNLAQSRSRGADNRGQAEIRGEFFLPVEPIRRDQLCGKMHTRRLTRVED